MRIVFLAAFCLLMAALPAQEQQADTTQRFLYLKGSAGITNNGFSIIPAFSLGKPAAVFTFSLNGGRRLSFEPEFRFSLEGRPWSFIFIGRYKLVERSKFRLTLGAHLPGMPFRSVEVIHEGEAKNLLMAQMAVAGELMPLYSPRKNLRLGLHYLHGQGVDGQMPNTDFLAFQLDLDKIPLHRRYYARFQPQAFFLRVEDSQGYYVSGSLSLMRRRFPLSLSASMYAALRTEVEGPSANWNLSLTYYFDKTYVQKRR